MVIPKPLLLVGAAIGSWLIIHCAIITYDGLTDNLQKSDIAVVFGNEVQPSGEPSERLKARLQKTVELYQAGFFQKIIVSGGKGKEGFDESLVMKNYLISHNIPENIIITDPDGNTTWQTVENTRKILEKEPQGKIMAISQFYHMSRIELAFSKNGIKNIATAHADFFEIRDIYSLVREYAGYYEYLLR
ncbi:MAG: YdcF family protein [Candidatus Gracilibacteria bacterium]